MTITDRRFHDLITNKLYACICRAIQNLKSLSEDANVEAGIQDPQHRAAQSTSRWNHCNDNAEASWAALPDGMPVNAETVASTKGTSRSRPCVRPLSARREFFSTGRSATEAMAAVCRASTSANACEDERDSFADLPAEDESESNSDEASNPARNAAFCLGSCMDRIPASITLFALGVEGATMRSKTTPRRPLRRQGSADI
eukprot:359219-Chlamydomonas_euryale.AAC.22